MSTQCDSCALGNKGGACLEPYNSLRAQICALGGIPFACHTGFDWQKGETAFLEIPSNQRKMCAGWQAKIREYKAAGRFDEYAPIRRAIAQTALASIEEMIRCGREPQDLAGYNTAHRRIGKCLRLLAASPDKFPSMTLDYFEEELTCL